MRYSIIHHDVRERFGLTMGEYVVADSIHQLSHSGPTLKSGREIARFLGIDEGSVRNAKKKLLEKGLINEGQFGANTTPLWSEAVTYLRSNSAPLRKKSALLRNNSESHLIYKEDKEVVIETNELPILEVDEEPKAKRASGPRPKVDDVLKAWNDYANPDRLKRKIVRNDSAKKVLLPEAKPSDTLTGAIIRKRTKYALEDFQGAFKAYALDVVNRVPEKGKTYHAHRYTMYEFLTHKDVFERYVTR